MIGEKFSLDMQKHAYTHTYIDEMIFYKKREK
jgi:hypothetical protein